MTQGLLRLLRKVINTKGGLSYEISKIKSTASGGLVIDFQDD